MERADRVQCRAVLFDLDGVLVDSLPLVETVLRAWARRHQLDAEQVIATAHGRRDADMIAHVAPHLDADAETRWILAREETTFTGLTAAPGAERLLARLLPDQWAVVTSGTHRVATGRLAAAGLPSPRHLVTADRVEHGKPHPEGYQRGAELLGLPASQCLVVEDASAGVEAARAAGARCLGLGTTLATSQASLDLWAPDLAAVHIVKRHHNLIVSTDAT